MSSHRFHPDPARNDPDDALLFDDCERCADHARSLVSLDDPTLRALHDLALGDVAGRTAVEREAASALYRNVVLAQHLARLGLVGTKAA